MRLLGRRPLPTLGVVGEASGALSVVVELRGCEEVKQLGDNSRGDVGRKR